jgi:hypothetical protein
MSAVNFFERIPQIGEGESADGRSHLENGRGHAHGKKNWEKHGNTNAEPQAYSSGMTAVPRRTLCDRSINIGMGASEFPAGDKVMSRCPIYYLGTATDNLAATGT